MKAGRLISIIDDDEAVRTSLKLLIESAGYRGVTFKSAEEYLQLGLMNNADCLLLDIRMPGMSGFDLKEHPAVLEAAIPVIFVTGHDRLGMEEKAMKLGAVAYLRKPFDDQVLLDAICKACKKEIRTEEEY
jgi:FixJ family two-component response regulator